MKKLSLLLVMLVLAFSAALPVAADGPPPSGRQGKSNNASLTLVSKDTSGTWAVVWPGPFGELKYNISNPGGFQARLLLHGLRPNSWYMATFQGPWPEDGLGSTDQNLKDSPGLWGGKSYGGLGWTDLALVKTDDEGNANAIIPTASGLTPGVSTCRPLAGLNTSPGLANGIYNGVRVVVKDVNDNIIPDCINATKLIWGTHPVLFEAQAMENFTVGP